LVAVVIVVVVLAVVAVMNIFNSPNIGSKIQANKQTQI